MSVSFWSIVGGTTVGGGTVLSLVGDVILRGDRRVMVPKKCFVFPPHTHTAKFIYIHIHTYQDVCVTGVLVCC